MTQEELKIISLENQVKEITEVLEKVVTAMELMSRRMTEFQESIELCR